MYIDPPYNTGNEGWIYNDNVNDPRIRKWLGDVVGKEGEDLSRHDKWLCMMYPRLKLLQRLLAEDGVIFISIDDTEYANLKLICDEIFGSDYFVSNISWQRTYSTRNDFKGIVNEEKVPTPSDFYYAKMGKPNIRKDGDFWQGQTVRAILRNEVYIGHTVQNKTGNVSYKIHKMVSKPKSEWIRVENTHEPIISQEVWDMVREIDAKQTKIRSCDSGETPLFSGVLYCADCGSPMCHYKDGRKRKDGSKSSYQSYACQRYASGGKTACSGHIMNQRVLIEVVLADIRSKAAIAQRNPDRLINTIQSQRQAATNEQMKQKQAELKLVDKRLAELSKLTRAIYEDRVLGKVPESVCIQLMNQYEAERIDKTDQKVRLTAELEAFAQNTSDVNQWLHLIRDYTKLEELDRPTLLRLVSRIEIGEKHQVGDHMECDIKIFYNFVGYIEA